MIFAGDKNRAEFACADSVGSSRCHSETST
jgi:hypothetical protein